MARARTIKPTFLHSRSMRAVSPMARLVFIELWLLADDAGRLVVTRVLPHQLHPGDREAAAALVPGWLAELEREHCIERYSVDGTEYLRIVNWRRHQKIYNPTPSRLPPRPVGARQVSGELHEPLGSESEKPSEAKALTSPAPIPERLGTLTNRSETSGQNAPAADLSPGFTSDSRGQGFLRRAAAAAQRALGR